MFLTKHVQILDGLFKYPNERNEKLLTIINQRFINHLDFERSNSKIHQNQSKAMKKIMIVVALIAVVLQTANAQWGNRNDRRDDARTDSRRGDDRRGDDRRNDDWRDNDRRWDDCQWDNGRWDDRRTGRNYNLGDRIDDFQREARRRIGIGIERGLLTSREARGLMRDVERIERKEQIFWRDGRLDSRERRNLMDDLYDLNRAITHEKRDNERSNYDDYGRYNDPRQNGRSRGW
jgi:hypothetical protein